MTKLNQHPLHLPEIIELISEYLTPSDRVNCLRVSRTFHAAIIPDVWHTIELTRLAGRALPFPTGAALERHKAYIRAIYFRGLYPSEYLPLVGCRNIQKLILDTTEDAYGTEALNQILVVFTALIESNASKLQDVNISADVGQLVPSKNLWKALMRCHSLNHLGFSGFKVPEDSLPLFFQVCGKARSIDLSYMMISRLPPMQNEDSGCGEENNRSGKHTVLEGPRKLKMRGSFGPGVGLSPLDQASLIRMCSNLESLTWRSGGDGASSLWMMLGNESSMNDHARIFCATLSKDPWPLAFLQFLDLSFCLMLDSDHASLICQIHRLRSYKAVSSRFGPLSLDALIGDQVYTIGRSDPEGGQRQRRHHRSSIEILCIDRCRNVTGEMILRILESCPNLTRFSGDSITVSEIAQGKSWVCNKLERLDVYISADDNSNKTSSEGNSDGDGDGDGDSNGGNSHQGNVERDDEESSYEFQEMQRVVYSRLSTLTKLQSLTLTNRTSQPCKEKRTLDLRLEAGLDILVNLKNLRELSFHSGVAQKMNVEEARWIAENWPRMRYLKGVWNKDESVLEKMNAILKFNQKISNCAYFA